MNRVLSVLFAAATLSLIGVSAHAGPNAGQKDRANPNAPEYLKGNEVNLQADLTYISQNILSQKGAAFNRACLDYFTKSRDGKLTTFFGANSKAREMHRTIGTYRSNAHHVILLANGENTRLETQNKNIVEAMLMIWSDTFDICIQPAKELSDALAKRKPSVRRTKLQQRQLLEAQEKTAQGFKPWVDTASLRLSENTEVLINAAK